MEGLVRSKREQILRVAQRHGVTAVRVFGSMARGDAGPNSDVDLLVDVGPQPQPSAYDCRARPLISAIISIHSSSVRSSRSGRPRVGRSSSR